VSSFDNWGNYDTPCKVCGAVTKWWYFDSGCDYSLPISGIACTRCHRKYTQKEWDAWEEENEEKKVEIKSNVTETGQTTFIFPDKE
jgi:hypothetical protein